MFFRKSVWGAALLVLALPAFVTAQDQPSSSSQPMQCPMMQSGSGMQMSGMMAGGAMQPDMMMQRMRGMQQPQAAGYDKAAEVTVTGTVTDVMQPPDANGLHLAFKTADETIEVRLGPKAWLDSHGYTFAAGDELTILGSKSTTHDMATMTNTTALVARQITKHGETMVLRDESGRPMWAGPNR